MQDDSFSTDLTPNCRRVELVLPVSEFVAVLAAARRHATEPHGSSTIQLLLEEDHRTWIFPEQNVTSWFSEFVEEDDAAAHVRGLFTLPVHFIESLSMSLTEAAPSVDITIDLDTGTLSSTSRQNSFSTTLPDQQSTTGYSRPKRTSRITVNGGFLTECAFFLQSIPVDIDADEPEPTPFIRFDYQGDNLVMSRDWSEHSGPKITVSTPAGGDFRGSFAMFAPVFAREISEIGLDAGLVGLEFVEGEPNIMRLVNGEAGMVVELAHEYVVQYRTSLELALKYGDAELTVEESPCRDWDPTVVVTAGTRTVTATITEGEPGKASYIRLSTEIMSDVQWSPQLATEVNAWNDKWPTVKLVHSGTALRAVADIPVAAVSTASRAVVDLVDKAQIVEDLVVAVL